MARDGSEAGGIQRVPLMRVGKAAEGTDFFRARAYNELSTGVLSVCRYSVKDLDWVIQKRELLKINPHSEQLQAPTEDGAYVSGSTW